jgi:HD superfamily phosphohydrolase YqeK
VSDARAGRRPLRDRSARAAEGTTPGPAATAIDLPVWAVVSERRRGHIARVVALIDGWADDMAVPAPERAAWRDAARWHDALRDAPEPVLRAALGDQESDANLLHGPAAAARLAADGERRAEVLEAVRWHTTGSVTWGRTGRALYMADFLEPERAFARDDRQYLARQAPADFDGTFRQVVRLRLEWALREGKPLLPPTVALWNAVR